jgi:hypothetical protein
MIQIAGSQYRACMYWVRHHLGWQVSKSSTKPTIVIYCDSKYWTLNSADPINTLREGKATLASPFDVRGSARLSSVVISPNGIRGVVSNFSA